MMTQSVMTQTVNLFGNAGGSTLKVKQAGSGFDQYIDNSFKTTKNTDNYAEATTAKKDSGRPADVKENFESDDSSTAEKATDTTKTGNTNTSKVTEQKADKKTESVTDAESKETDSLQTDEQTVSEQTMAQIMGVLQSIQEVAMKTLNLSEEELNHLLTSQGMNIGDLLQPENLQQLVLANSGETNILAALTDENLANTMEQLLQAVDGIKTESNLGLSNEQMQAIISQVEAQTENGVNLSLTAEQTATKQAVILKQSETINVVETTKSKEDTNGKTVNENNTQTDVAKTITTEEKHTQTQSNSENESHSEANTSEHFQTFVDNMVKASQNTQFGLPEDMIQATNLKEIATQIIDQIKVSITPNQTTMELQLNPENLGKVNLSLHSKDGVISAHFVVQNEISKEAIESQMQTLKDTLTQQGIKVEAIEVTVSANAFEQNTSKGSDTQEETQKNNSGKQISLEDALGMTEVAEDDIINENVIGIKGNMVDYSA